MYRKAVLGMIVATGLVTLASLFILRSRFPRQELRTCFNDARGLRPGASVRIAGVDVGVVRVVRANPENKNCPAEVVMDLSTPYELKIPRDSIAEIQTGGLLGPSLVAIDVTQATREPIDNGGYLMSKQSSQGSSSSAP
jgi:ABC-type transporter Mla subunit MlaD